MNNKVATAKNATPQVFFEVEEGSNYKVILTYDREEVIEFAQFQKLAQVLLHTDAEFVTINKRIVQRRDIRMIEPTTDWTEKDRIKFKAIEDRKRDQESARMKASSVYVKFKTEFLNERIGVGKWSAIKIVGDKRLMNELWTAFTKQHPKESEILSEGTNDSAGS